MIFSSEFADYEPRELPEFLRKIAPPPEANHSAIRIYIAKQFPGWTLDYIDELLEKDPWFTFHLAGYNEGVEALSKR